MADEPAVPEAGGAALDRVRGFVGRARRLPGAVEEVAGEVAASHAAVDELREALARLEELAWAGRDDTRGGVAAVGGELHVLRDRLDAVRAGVDRVDASVAAHATALHRAVAAPARRAAAASLRESLGPAPALRPGLSVFTLCWNHGELLADSVRSGLAVLDALPADEQGEVLVLDDASTDRTPDVAAALADTDPRVRVVRSQVNLGLALARTTLLHVAGTAHAFQLDADNTAVAEGVLELYESARATGAALTYGNVVQVAADGRPVGPISNEPPTPALFRSNYVDTMAVADVAAFRRLGGWSPDPLLEHVDDWAALHRVVEAGLLVAFVPTVAGRYTVLDTAFHRSVGDARIGAGRVARVFDPTGRRQGPDALRGVAAVAHHPAVGALWATPEAVALRPDLAPRLPGHPPTPEAVRRVLVVAPGGVANLGDDAITVRGLERVRKAFPGAAVDLVTDGHHLPTGLGAARWLGPLVDVLPGLGRSDLGALDDALAAAAERHLVGQGRWRPLDPGAYDAAVLLGGGTLGSGWVEGLVEPRALLAAALRHAGVPHALSGQGIGPLDAEADRALVGDLLAGAAAVGCRDRRSADLAASLPGVDPARVRLTGDDALGLEGARESVPGGPDARPRLAVTVRRAAYVGSPAEDGGDDPSRAWAEAADALAAERGWDVVAIALNHQAPEPEVATLSRIRATTPLRARWSVMECGADPRRLVDALAGSTAVAAQSYHAALLALAAGTPAVLGAATPYYEAKADGLAELLGLPEALAVTTPDDLPAALAAVESACAGAAADGVAPAAAARREVERWWAALPAAVGVGASG